MGVPYRIRTGVAAVRGRCPGPLDEGDEVVALISPAARAIKPRGGWAGLFAKIQILQRLLDLQAANHGDRRLKIVALLAGYPQLVALDRHLHLELAVLDLADQLPGEIGVDPLTQHDRLAHPVARGLLGRLEIECGGVDLAPRQMHFQQLMHLLELQLVISEQGDQAFLPLDRAFAALEVEARADLARDPGERVVDLGQVEARDDVEARHGSLLHELFVTVRYSVSEGANPGPTSPRGRRAPSPRARSRAKPVAPTRAGD